MKDLTDILSGSDIKALDNFLTMIEQSTAAETEEEGKAIAEKWRRDREEEDRRARELNASMERSVQNGMEFLKTNAHEIIFSGKYGFSAKNEAAQKLDDAICCNVGHSGASFSWAFRQVCVRATKEKIAEVWFKLENSQMILVTDKVRRLPETTTDIIIRPLSTGIPAL